MKRLRLVLALLGVAVCGWVSQAAAQNALFAVLTGAAVCDLPENADPPTCRLGDLDGAGSATVLITGPTSLCATIVVDNLDFSNTSYPTAASIHIGQASYSGPVVVQLNVPKYYANGDPGTSMTCRRNVAADMIEKMQKNPEFFYINVRAQGLWYGALRGQLF